jgi:hypothetical protein
MDFTLPKFPIKVPRGFQKTSELHATLWAHPIGRAFVLLWRPGHLVNQNFWREAHFLVQAIEREKPSNLFELKRVFQPFTMSCSNFTSGDVAAFLPLAMPYLLGEKEVPYEWTEPDAD